ncbi:MAG TPA: PIG-L deacetylase family protein [Syntrophomonadaceae bacterium]|nr:PIG-L deacetylase family protein [Syntrophomonadaceae bacterium]
MISRRFIQKANEVKTGKRKRVMVFAPHPDDDILGCGGSICWHRAQGHEVSIVYLTCGEAGTRAGSSQELKTRRQDEARQGAALLEVQDLIFLGFPDGGLEIQEETLDRVIQLLREKRPYTIYFPHIGELHRDHVKTCELVSEACRRAAGPWHPRCGPEPWEVGCALTYEVWSPLPCVNLVRNITPFMDLKIQALRKHESQLLEIAYDEGILGLNRYRGVTTGRGVYCECFQVVKAR